MFNVYSNLPYLASDSAYNLSVEFAKYLRKHYPKWFAYIVVPDDAHMDISWRGDEKELEEQNIAYFLKIRGVEKMDNGAASFMGKEILSGLRSLPIYWDVILNNNPWRMVDYLLLCSRVGLEPSGIVSKPDWFLNRTWFTTGNVTRFLRDMLVFYSRYYPVVMHSKYCLKLLGLDEESDEAQTLLKWGLMHPPYDGEKIIVETDKGDGPYPRIIFNHRFKPYTGFTTMLRAVHYLVKKENRRDFRIILSSEQKIVGGSFGTSAELKNMLEDIEEVIIWEDMRRGNYFHVLSKCDAALAWHEPLVNGWSISVTEAVASGCYPIVHGQAFYKEMLGEDLPTYNLDWTGLVDAIRFFLDNQSYCRKLAQHYRDVVKKWSWETQIHKWVGVLKMAIDEKNDGKLSFLRDLIRGLDVVDFSTVCGISKSSAGEHKIRSGRYSLSVTGQKSNFISGVVNTLRSEGYEDIGGKIPIFMKVRALDGEGNG